MGVGARRSRYRVRGWARRSGGPCFPLGGIPDRDLPDSERHVFGTVEVRAARPQLGIDGRVEPVGGEAAAPCSKLHEALPRLIGRDQDLAVLAALLDGHRLVTVTGAGGIGKTRLLQRLLRERRLAQGHVGWVELSPVSDAALVAGAIGRSLGLDIGSGDPLRGLVKALKPRALLIGLDNAEHLVDEVARVVEVLLSEAPGVRFVVTSQAPLEVDAEQMLRLEPLATPAAVLEPAEALRYSAVALFVQRAQVADRRFVLDEHNVASIIEICRRLDGIALAIEMAAAHVPLLGAAALAAALNDRLWLLSSQGREGPPRQRTLRTALEWSDGLLGTVERAALRRLGLFAGSFSLEMALEVVPESKGDADRWATLDALGVLVDRSLVVADAADPPRYRLLESTRAFALERLAEADETNTWRARHARAVRDIQGYPEATLVACRRALTMHATASREPNALLAVGRAEKVARESIDDAEFEQFWSEGADMGDTEISAFGLAEPGDRVLV